MIIRIFAYNIHKVNGLNIMTKKITFLILTMASTCTEFRYV